jgi:hypothetical protein
MAALCVPMHLTSKYTNDNEVLANGKEFLRADARPLVPRLLTRQTNLKSIVCESEKSRT